MRRPAARLSLALSAGLAILLSACSAPAATSPSSSAAAGTIPVVTSTNVYGDIVRSIGGDKVSVDAIISKTSQDPHSYEANAQDKLAVSKAKLLVENGGGYDGFLHKLADDTGFDHANIVTAVEATGLAPHEDEASHSAEEHDHDHGAFNEHVWYDPAAMAKVADAVAARLGALAPASAAEFTANAGKFKTALAGITGKLDALKVKHANTPVAITEPVPVYLLQAAGLVNKTPAEYSDAIEEDTDVSPAVLKETKDLFAAGGVKLLAYNEQTEGPQTEAVKDAATAAGIPVVDFTETIPDGKNYLEWMEGNADALAGALK
ncbi:metal ABC transporter solute-binding protein, Zn/Mn family [Arthrobacter cupressi]|uniref:Zinc/manganese transport system substrate-binding protein n=1 Tax=Arthrobacter cupressi TaxID=1045773 RepID=A0A1G8TZ16_9MICC|nr:zinc ABC transporter substrate-binding protein [Arthrobacter cupressi]NYD76635.1 zinc/manganese transport system substrate-binding protein [Arthrobacter cupressi]SDJ46624.1 zinc/manganese transport system substrate-binding protein [Arthrobacter cupressi]